jgi:hypothetical protein
MEGPTPLKVARQNAMTSSTIFTFEELHGGTSSDTDSDHWMEPTLQVPSFMTINNNPYHTIKGIVDEIFRDHRCYDCAKFLCCSGTIFHDINCWYFDFCGSMDLDKLRQIYTYRIDVFKGVMKEWERYAFEPFDPETHIKVMFGAQHYGFYVRCFTCKECCKKNNSTCHVNYHHHG